MAHATAYRLIPDCKVSLDGKVLEISDDARLTRIEVDLDVDLFGQAVLVFNDPKLALINGKQFQSGTPVKVEMGFHTRLKKVFEGEVVALEPVFRRDTPPSLKVVCQESLHRLALSQMTRAFNDVDDKEIATKIAQEHGLSAKAPSGTKEHILQGNITDAAFLRRLAAKHGNVLRIEGKKLIIGPPPKGEEVEVKPGDGLKQIKVRIKSNTQVSEVSVHGWDPKTKKEIVGKAKPSGELQKGAKEHGNKSTLSIAGHEHAPADVATAEAMAKGRLARIAEGFTTADGVIVGNPGVVPGAVLAFDKLGDKIDGTYRVDHAAHNFSKHGYWVSFKATRVAKKKPPPIVVKPPPPKPPPGKDTPHAKRLQHLVLRYEPGHGTTSGDIDAQWEKLRHGAKIENLKFEYRFGTADKAGGDDDQKLKAQAERLQNLKFGYAAAEAAEDDPDSPENQEAKAILLAKLAESYAPPPAPDEPPEAVEQRKRAQIVQLQNLSEDYRSGSGSSDA